MRCNGLPAAGHGVGACAVLNSFRLICSVICTKECFADGIKTINLGIYGVNSVMITTLSVFCLVENSGINHLYFAGTVISLEVSAVIICIPETPFNIRENGKCLRSGRIVGNF